MNEDGTCSYCGTPWRIHGMECGEPRPGYPLAIPPRNPADPQEFARLLAWWAAENERLPASEQQTAMACLFGVVRDLLPVHEGTYRPIDIDGLRVTLAAAFPDIQEQVYAGNASAAEMPTHHSPIRRQPEPEWRPFHNAGD